VPSYIRFVVHHLWSHRRNSAKYHHPSCWDFGFLWLPLALNRAAHKRAIVRLTRPPSLRFCYDAHSFEWPPRTTPSPPIPPFYTNQHIHLYPLSCPSIDRILLLRRQLRVQHIVFFHPSGSAPILIATFFLFASSVIRSIAPDFEAIFL
jgi:hypothetical protein